MRHILLIATAIAVGAVTGNIVVRCVLLAAIVILTFGLSWLMQLLRVIVCLHRSHDTVPLKRIGKEAFVVQCMRCGWLYLKTHENGRDYYRHYRGQFDDFEDYAVEPAEAEPKFVDGDSSNV